MPKLFDINRVLGMSVRLRQSRELFLQGRTHRSAFLLVSMLSSTTDLLSQPRGVRIDGPGFTEYDRP